MRFDGTPRRSARRSRELIPLVPRHRGAGEEGRSVPVRRPAALRGRRFPTPDGKARFATFEPPERDAARGRQFALTTRRGKQFNSIVQEATSTAHRRGARDVLISRPDAERLGPPDGSRSGLAQRPRRVRGPRLRGAAHARQPPGPLAGGPTCSSIRSAAIPAGRYSRLQRRADAAKCRRRAPPASGTRTRVLTVEGEQARELDDLAVEEPLEIRLAAGGEARTLVVTMRTPGEDRFGSRQASSSRERVVTRPGEIQGISYCTDPELDAGQQYNVVRVGLAASALPELRGLERHSFTSSACGVCGRAGIESLEASGCDILPLEPEVSAEVLLELPESLRGAQGIFESTGGLHAAGLFTVQGELLCLREDVGRHNAVDKVIGWALLEGRLPLSADILMVSGRSSYEIVQKALAAGVPIVCSVSAPSSLAVDVATRFGMTLVGFLRDGRFNVYAGPERLVSTAQVGE